jgi:hypothetical protein
MTDDETRLDSEVEAQAKAWHSADADVSTLAQLGGARLLELI